jgi:hypothetical protein
VVLKFPDTVSPAQNRLSTTAKLALQATSSLVLRFRNDSLRGVSFSAGTRAARGLWPYAAAGTSGVSPERIGFIRASKGAVEPRRVSAW